MKELVKDLEKSLFKKLDFWRIKPIEPKNFCTFIFLYGAELS